jgi:hypothetical protein
MCCPGDRSLWGVRVLEQGCSGQQYSRQSRTDKPLLAPWEALHPPFVPCSQNWAWSLWHGELCGVEYKFCLRRDGEEDAQNMTLHVAGGHAWAHKPATPRQTHNHQIKAQDCCTATHSAHFSSITHNIDWAAPIALISHYISTLQFI